MLIITQTALELGFLYALVAMALFLSYRILDIADLTTDGCFVLGAAVSVTVTAAGHLSSPSRRDARGRVRGLCHRVFADEARRAVDPRRYRHEHRPLHREPDGHGLEIQPEPARRQDDLHDAARDRHRRRVVRAAARSVCHASGRSSAGAVSRHAHGSFHPRHGR